MVANLAVRKWWAVWALAAVLMAALAVYFVLSGWDRSDKMSSTIGLFVSTIGLLFSIYEARRVARIPSTQGPEHWSLASTEVRVEHGTRRAGTVYNESHTTYGVPWQETIKYHDEQVVPLREKNRTLQYENDALQSSLGEAEAAYSMTQQQLSHLRWRVMPAFLLIVAMLGFAVARSTSPLVTPRATKAGNVQTGATPPSLNEQVDQFLLDYYTDAKEGGLGDVKVIDRYFADPFSWYQSKDLITDRAGFAATYRTSGFSTAKCSYQPATATNIDEDGSQLVVYATLEWKSITRRTTGDVSVIYTLRISKEGKPFRIVGVKDDPNSNPSCKD
jgi:hypothetical protein